MSKFKRSSQYQEQHTDDLRLLDEFYRIRDTVDALLNNNSSNCKANPYNKP